MCDQCDWEDFLERANTLLSDVDDLPERAEEFAEGVREKTSGMVTWAEENKHVTDKMEIALSNMQDGAGRWLHR